MHTVFRPVSTPVSAIHLKFFLSLFRILLLLLKKFISNDQWWFTQSAIWKTMFDSLANSGITCVIRGKLGGKITVDCSEILLNKWCWICRFKYKICLYDLKCKIIVFISLISRSTFLNNKETHPDYSFITRYFHSSVRQISFIEFTRLPLYLFGYGETLASGLLNTQPFVIFNCRGVRYQHSFSGISCSRRFEQRMKHTKRECRISDRS